MKKAGEEIQQKLQDQKSRFTRTNWLLFIFLKLERIRIFERTFKYMYNISVCSNSVMKIPRA